MPSYIRTESCPHCAAEIPVSRFEGDFEGEDELEITCPSCEGAVFVHREWHPSYTLRKEW